MNWRKYGAGLGFIAVVAGAEQDAEAEPPTQNGSAVTVIPGYENTPPSCEPLETVVLEAGKKSTIIARCSDHEEGNLYVQSWLVDGSGAGSAGKNRLDYVFGAGQHQVTASVADSQGASATVSANLTVPAAAAQPVAPPQVVLPTPADVRKYTLDAHVGLGVVDLRDLQTLKLPTNSRETSYATTDFQLEVALDRFNYQVHNYWNLLLDARLGVSFLKKQHTIDNQNVGEMGGTVFDFRLAPGAELRLNEDYVKVLARLVLEAQRFNLTGTIDRPDRMANARLEDTHYTLVTGVDFGVSGVFGTDETHLFYEAFLGPHRFVDGKTDAAGTIGKIGLRLGFQSRYVAAGGGFDYLFNSPATALTNDSLEVQVAEWRLTAYFIVNPWEHVGLGAFYTGFVSRPSAIDSVTGQDIPIQHDYDNHQVIFGVSVHFGKETASQQPSQAPVVPTTTQVPLALPPMAQPVILPAPVTAPQLTPEPAPAEPAPERPVQSAVLYEKDTSVYGDNEPFEMYTRLAKTVRGLPQLNLSDYNSRRAEVMLQFDHLLTLGPEQFASTAFVLDRDKLALDLSMCKYGHGTFTRMQAKAGGTGLGDVVNSYRDALRDACKQATELYKQNDIRLND